MPTAAFTTLGCKVNQYETQRILDDFEARGFAITEFNAPADVYVIKRVLVGFGDAEAEKLLAAVHAAMRPDSRLLVMEPMVTGDDFGTGTGLDVLMLVLNEGRVRTAEEFSRLLEVAGFTTSRVLEAGLLRIVEAQRG